MNGARSSSVVDDKVLFQQVFKILDSKIKFLEYQTNQIIQSHVDPNNFSLTSPTIYSAQKPKLDSEKTSNNQILDMIETYSRSTTILLKLRTNLSIENVRLIFDLLNQDDLFKRPLGELDILLHTPQKLARRLFS